MLQTPIPHDIPIEVQRLIQIERLEDEVKRLREVVSRAKEADDRGDYSALQNAIHDGAQILSEKRN